MARWYSCNVLQIAKEGRQVWQFSGAGDKLQQQESRLPTEPLPAKLIGKDWQTLLQPRLNIAWFPAEHVFLRAVQLPKSDPAEMQSMVELQLEKLSPLPVAQIVWSFEPLSHLGGQMQTVIVIIVARSIVEEFLGQIEGQGYLADRLEVPLLDQIRSTQVKEDGVWIYPVMGTEKNHCVLAWWYGGVLCNLTLVHLPPSEKRTALLKEQITQVTWAGELEGWLTSPPRLHVVTDANSADPWLLTFIREESAQVVAPTSPQELAALTARRVSTNGTNTNLLPPEYTARYRQLFIDRLWMRGLGAVLMVYLLGLAIYFGWVQVDRWRYNSVADEVGRLGPTYTNVLRTKELVRVLQDQVDLQYAALDCYKAVAEFVPAELTLNSINFDLRSKKMTLIGTAAGDDRTRILDFNESLLKVVVKNQPLFTKVNLSTQPGAVGQAGWSLGCELKRGESE